MMTYGRVPSQSPPSRMVIAGPEIPVCGLRVKGMWVVFHDALYLDRCPSPGRSLDDYAREPAIGMDSIAGDSLATIAYDYWVFTGGD
jgi:hypothetical protein